MREYTIDLSRADTFEAFVSAFNDGFCRHVSGEWHGRSWDAFHDYLSWPEDAYYKLTFRGWADCRGLDLKARQMLQEIFNQNPHVQVTFT